MITNGQWIFPIGVHTIFFGSKKLKELYIDLIWAYFYKFGKKSVLFLLIISAIVLQDHFEDSGNIFSQRIPIWRWKYFTYPFTWENCKFSEQSRTELFYLIRNNVVDIIKPEEVDDLIKEGIIENKVRIIQVQLDGLTYLIYACNSQWLVPDKDGKLILCTKNYQNSEENTKHVLIDLPNNFSKPCIKRLEKSVLVALIHNKCNAIVSFNSNLDYFYPKKYSVLEVRQW